VGLLCYGLHFTVAFHKVLITLKHTSFFFFPPMGKNDNKLIEGQNNLESTFPFPLAGGCKSALSRCELDGAVVASTAGLP
jgi:hypothetical protein